MVKCSIVAPENCLPLYTDMQSEGLIPIVFYDSAMDAETFMELMRSSIMLRVEVHGTLMGLGWLRDIQEQTASVHFCFFKAGRGQTERVGLAFLYHVFSTSRFLSLYGLTPKTYRSAVRFVSAVGGNILGEVAGKCVLHHRGGRIVSGVVSTFNRGEYVNGR